MDAVNRNEKMVSDLNENERIITSHHVLSLNLGKFLVRIKNRRKFKRPKFKLHNLSLAYSQELSMFISAKIFKNSRQKFKTESIRKLSNFNFQ